NAGSDITSASVLGDPDTRMTIAGVTDGLSNTIAVAERSGLPQMFQKGKPIANQFYSDGVWASWTCSTLLFGTGAAGGLNSSGGCVMNCNNVAHPYGFHSGGVTLVRGDGSVAFLRDSTTPAVLAAMVTRAGGEVVSGDAW